MDLCINVTVFQGSLKLMLGVTTLENKSKAEKGIQLHQ